MKFDVVIIDEATQALEAVCWIPILKGETLILAGDPMQLPPTILSIGSRASKSKPNQLAASTTELSTKTAAIDLDEAEESEAEAEILVASEDEADARFESSSECGVEDLPTVADGVVEGKKDETQKPPKKVAKKKSRGMLRPPRSLEVTLFDRLQKMYGKRLIRMLQVQYRMHEDICAFPTKTLYASKLKSDASVAGHLLRDLPNVGSLGSDEEDAEVLGTPVVFFDTAGCEYFERVDSEGEGDEGSKSNENEAAVVKNWVDRLAAAGVLPSQIAVITPYQAQVTLLSSLLRPVHGPDLEIGTVDGMQGREKEAVIISMVRSNDAREVGFLKEKRRLNVAMTRARRHLCVVGDSSTVKHGSDYLKDWMAWMESHADVRFGGLD